MAHCCSHVGALVIKTGLVAIADRGRGRPRDRHHLQRRLKAARNGDGTDVDIREGCWCGERCQQGECERGVLHPSGLSWLATESHFYECFTTLERIYFFMRRLCINDRFTGIFVVSHRVQIDAAKRIFKKCQ